MENCLLRKKTITFRFPPSSSLFKNFCIYFLISSFCISATAQQKAVSGRVTAGDSALVGATIQVKGTSTATQTTPEGLFTINAPANGTLVISSVGFSTQEVPINGRSTINIRMGAANQQMNEVVVVGYGTQRKATVTGSVATVRGSELDKSPALNLSNSLAGRMPGITALQRTGEPGFDGSTIRIRGTNTLGNSGPLVVIDGIPDRAGGFDRLNPADIESVSVLKDASAAIYGARAANGVILITTKQGKSGKTSVSYDLNYGWQQPTVVPKMSNAAQYGELLNEQVLFSSVPYQQWPAAWQALKNNGTYVRTDNNQTVNAFYGPQDIQKFADGSSPWTHPNTDWYKSVFKPWSAQQQHTLQLSGGSENVRFLSTLGYQDQDAYYKNSATGYKQYDFRFNLEAKINQYVTATLGLTAREEYRFFPTVGAGDIFRMLIRGKPTEVAIWPKGEAGMDIENGQNPVSVTTGTTGYDRNRRDYFQSNGQVDIRNPWIPGLKLTLQGAADKFIGRSKRWQTPWSLYSWDKVSLLPDGTPKLTKTVRSTFTDPMLRHTDEEELRIALTSMLNYEHSFNSIHNINLLAGIQKETRRGDNFFAYRRNFISPAVDELAAGGTASQDIGNVLDPGGRNSTFGAQARLSYFGRVAYNYKEKYLAEFLWRSDGSYIFPEVGRFGFFPGVLIGWNVAREGFFENINFLSALKLRASYGQMGNDRVEFNGVLQEYAYLPTYSITGVQVINGQIVRTLTEQRVPNFNFTWEVANNANFGIEGAVLNNRLFFEFDIFNNQRKQILIANTGSTPQSSGISTRLPPVNGGHVENKGWEFRVGYNGQVSRDFNFTVGANGGYSKNKIKYWNENPGVPAHQRATGHTFGTNGPAFLAYVYDGVFLDAAEVAGNKIDYSAAEGSLRPGDMKFKDISGPDGKPDGKITSLDQVRLDKNRDPRFTYGINLTMSYKNFDLSALFQGAAGGLQLLSFNETGEFGNWLQWAYENRWSVDKPSSEHPRLVSRTNRYYTSGFGNNTYFIRANNYLRFKNIEIGYTLGSNIGQRVGISRLRIYVSGLNLLTWEKFGFWDPETIATNGYAYPQSRIISTGFRVTF
jgi:TonB-linked SusC/RagA family outer membrane protein